MVGTAGTIQWLAEHGVKGEAVSKINEGRPNVLDVILNRQVCLVINTPSGGIARADGYEIRAAAVAADKALFTTMAVLGAAVSALPVLREGFRVKSLQEYAADRRA